MAKVKEKSIPVIPPLDEELIRALDTRFPPKCPKVTDSEREIWTYVGKRQLVEFLIEQFERQQENTL